MTHIRSTLVAALLTFGAAAVASAQATNPAPQTTARAQHQKGSGRHHGDRAMLKGVSLTTGEKANLKNVQAKYAPQMKALREQFKPQSQAMRDAHQRGDTATVRSLWEKNAPQRQQTKQLLDAQRAEFRAALSPENQAKFDANVQRAQARMAKHGGLKKGGHPGAATSK